MTSESEWFPETDEDRGRVLEVQRLLMEEPEGDEPRNDLLKIAVDVVRLERFQGLRPERAIMVARWWALVDSYRRLRGIDPENLTTERRTELVATLRVTKDSLRGLAPEIGVLIPADVDGGDA